MHVVQIQYNTNVYKFDGKNTVALLEFFLMGSFNKSLFMSAAG